MVSTTKYEAFLKTKLAFEKYLKMFYDTMRNQFTGYFILDRRNEK